MVALPDSSNFICSRRTEILPIARPRAITSATSGFFAYFSMVRVEQCNQAAISSWVH
jgi:hypothetical protein